MTIESPKQKRSGTNQKKQKRGGASRPKDHLIIPPSDSAAWAAARPRLDGCAGTSIVDFRFYIELRFFAALRMTGGRSELQDYL